MSPEKAYAMIFAPHPDDAEGGIGGTMVNWAREGKRVVLVICTKRGKGTNQPKNKTQELVKKRAKKTEVAAGIMGVSEVIFLRHPDQTIADVPEFRKEVTRLIRIYKPEVVATTDPERKYMSHPDHRNTGRVVLDAVSLYAHNLYAFPDLMDLDLHRVKDMLLWGSDSPNCCFDITNTFDIKMSALHCHKSQFGEPSEERTNRMRARYKAEAEKEDYELGEGLHRVNQGPPPPRPAQPANN
jgi:LmbE family N-acetylglucosaminyl deacetylase